MKIEVNCINAKLNYLQLSRFLKTNWQVFQIIKTNNLLFKSGIDVFFYNAIYSNLYLGLNSKFEKIPKSLTNLIFNKNQKYF